MEPPPRWNIDLHFFAHSPNQIHKYSKSAIDTTKRILQTHCKIHVGFGARRKRARSARYTRTSREPPMDPMGLFCHITSRANATQQQKSLIHVDVF